MTCQAVRGGQTHTKRMATHTTPNTVRRYVYDFRSIVDNESISESLILSGAGLYSFGPFRRKHVCDSVWEDSDGSLFKDDPHGPSSLPRPIHRPDLLVSTDSRGLHPPAPPLLSPSPPCLPPLHPQRLASVPITAVFGTVGGHGDQGRRRPAPPRGGARAA